MVGVEWRWCVVLLEAVEKKFCCNSCWVLKMNIDPLKQSVHIVIGSVPPPCLTISDQFKCLFIVVVVPFPHIACRENLRENSTGKHSNHCNNTDLSFWINKPPPTPCPCSNKWRRPNPPV